MGKRRKAESAALDDTKEDLDSSQVNNRGTQQNDSDLPPLPPPTELPVDPIIGSIIDQRYLVFSQIARGGMATVYLGHDERLDRTVAIKVMHPHLAESPDLVARFRREARAIARLSHPGVVNVFDQGVIQGSGYLVMELVEGPNLRQLLRANGSFTLGRTLELCEGILDALAAAHRSGLIHRDVKPENVLIPADNRPKVADFGLARAVSEVTMASTGSVLGTVAYLAPELVTSVNADVRADVYSVGVMLYELIAGRPPYQGVTPIQIAFAHVHEDVPPLSESVDWIPPEVDQLIASFASRDRDQRPADAAMALENLRAVRERLSPELLERRTQVEPVEELADTAITKTGDGTTAIDYGHRTSALPMTPAPAAKDQQVSKRHIWITTVVLAALILAGLGIWFFQFGPGAYTRVPDLVGLPQAQAIQVLKSQKLAYKVSEDFSDTITKGIVITTTPGPSNKVRKDGRVTLHVSKGIEYVQVPILVGLPKDKALAALKAAKLAPGKVTEDWSEQVAKDAVISVTPNAGQTLKHDSTVDLLISKGKKPIPVPALVGMSSANAAKAIKDLLLVADSTEALSEVVPRGQVISQTPEAGTNLFQGGKVSYVVSRGPAQVEIPDLIGMTSGEAKSALESLGFVVKIEYPLGNANLDRVYRVSPHAHKKAANGSTVTLTVV